MSINPTKIEWVRNPEGTLGYSWNPITGCLNNCTYCYARRLANTRLRGVYLANNIVAGGFPLAQGVLNENATPPELNPFYPRFWQSRLNDPLYGSPKGIFVCDMSDLFGIGIPEGWTNEVLHTINRSPQHLFYLLTKQPQNLAKFEFPDNCWVGVSATDRPSWIKAQQYLEDVEAKVKYYSFEPLLGDIVGQPNTTFFREALKISGISWVIIGQQTPIRSETTPKIEWITEIIEACDKARVAVFIKNNLGGLLQIKDTSYLPEWANIDGKLRQEMPGSKRA